MIRSIKAITTSAFISMFFLGVSASLIGAAAKSIGLSPVEIGLLIAAQNVGFMVSVMISGAMADTHKKPRILFVGSVVLAFAYFTFYLSDLFWVNLVIMFLIGAGIGTYEGVTDAMLLDIHHTRQSFYINVNHLSVTLGSIAIAVYLMFLTINWRNAVVQSAIVISILAIVFALMQVNGKYSQHEPYLKRLQIIVQDRVMVSLFIATLLVIGVEAGTVGILTTFLTDLRNVPEMSAQVGLILFLVGIAIGRLLVGYFTDEGHVARMILLLLSSSFVIYAMLYYLDIGAVTFLFVFLAGLSMSALVPLVITLAGLLYPTMAGTVLGAIKVAMPVGGIILPFLMSMITKSLSLEVALILYPLAFLAAFLILLPVLRRIDIRVEDTSLETA